VLEVMQGPQAGTRFRLEPGRTVVGRHPSCGIVLDAVSVSRQHAALEVEGNQAWIEDLGSRNGTAVDGRRISGRHALIDGQHLRIGDQRLAFSSSAPLTVQHLLGSGAFAIGDLVEEGADSVILSAVEVPVRPELAAGDPEKLLRAAGGLDRAIGASVVLEEVLPRTLDGLFQIFPQAERGFLLLVEPESRRLVVRASKFAPTVEAGPLLLSRSLMERVMQSRQALLSADVAADSGIDVRDSVADCGIRSVMCVPFRRADGDVLGVLQLDRRDTRTPFRRHDLDLLAGVAAQVTLAIEQAQAHEERLSREQLRRDLELANRVQQALLPSRPPEIPGYESFDYYEPARQISGDFFSYVPLPGGRTAVVLADVSGKGMSAALVMAALAADVRYCLASESDVATAVGRINESFCRAGWDDRFATLVVAVLDPATHRLSLVNAGHMPPLLRTAAGDVEAIGVEATGLPVGVDPEQVYQATDVGFPAGATLVCYTDGISEALDHAQRPYGIERLIRVVAAAEAAGDAGRRILADVERHAAGQIRSDDICLVCLSRAP
jgi:serine phosphatase RsbU (regulator of sigma subunit)